MNDALTILCGDALEQLRILPDQSVQTCATSPPYWGLRDYGNNGQIGLEKTPEEYVAKLVGVMREVRRVLRKDGTLWLNLGDSYAGSGKGGNPEGSEWAGFVGNKDRERSAQASKPIVPSGLKPKDLVGIPWRVAFALQADGWWLRQDIIWNKANCMPESVTDRCTKSHEYLFMLTKAARYYYDAEAIKEPASESDWESRIGRANLNNKLLPTEELNGIRPRVKYTPNAKRPHGSTLTGGLYGRHHLGDAIPETERRPDKQRGHSRRHDGFNDRWDAMEKSEQCSGMRNKRDVWTVAPANYPEAHFATYPPDLVKPCIMAGTRVGDTVLDPFAGSGTTGQVALELGRRAILIELNPKYVALIHKRCSTTLGLAL
jgi:site-specific DNA-methyltransferase (adenine-specific)